MRNPPFRAEHLGSLLRPSKLLNKRHAIQQKKDSEDGLPQLEDECIDEIVKIQTETGFHAISDGEYRRHMFWGTFFPTLNGMEEIYGPEAKIFREYVPDIAAFLEAEKVPGESVICTGKISHTGKSSYIGQFEYLKSITPKEKHGDIKMTLVWNLIPEQAMLIYNPTGCAQLVSSEVQARPGVPERCVL